MDGDALIYMAENLPQGAVFDPAAKTFTWTPNLSQSGIYSNVTFTVSDGSLIDSKAIAITVNNVNQAPVLDTIGNKIGNENQLIEFTLNVTDPDGDALTFSAANLPAGAIFNPTTKIFSWIPDYNQSGTYSDIIFTVSDGNLTASESIAITVNNTNRPPVMEFISNKIVDENQLLEFSINAADPDGDTLTYTATNLPTGAVFDIETKIFSWTPNTTQIGEYPQVTFQASDGNATDSKTMTITVNSINRPPVLDVIGDKTVNENQLLEFTVNATDPNNDELTYVVENLPEGASFEQKTHTFTWTPNYTQAGNYSNINFTVTDGSLTDSKSISITVNNINRPPVLSSIGNKTVNITQLLEFGINATDADGDAVTYSATNLPTGAVFNPATHTFTWTPNTTQAGIYNVIFSVTDGELTSDEQITIVVRGSVVSGALSGNQIWTKANSPYFVTGDISIPKGLTLTIEPGVEVKVTGNYKIKNYGTLNLQGAKSQPITFMSSKTVPVAGDWGGIYFYEDSNIKSIINYIIVEHAIRGISTTYMSVSITNSVFQNNQTGVYIYSAPYVDLFYNKIINNTQYGVACIKVPGQSTPKPTAHYNSIYNNGTYNWLNNYETTNSDNHTITINAENNWWGTADQTQIAAKIWDYKDSGYRPKMDTDPCLAGPMVMTDNIVNGRFFDHRRGEKVSIEYFLSEDSNVILKIFTYPDRNLVRTLVNNQQRPIGLNTEMWDGKNDLGADLPAGLYLYSIDVQTPLGTFSYDPSFAEVIGPTPTNIVITPNTEFSPLKGERMTIAFDLNEPAQVSLSGFDSVVFTDHIHGEGTGVEFWDGRDASGNIIIVASQLVPVKIATKPLPENILSIEHKSQVEITLLTTDPYLMRPLYNEVTQIEYSINNAADVTVKILSPDASEVLATLEQGIHKNAGTYTLVWNGRTEDGESIAEEGDYRVRVEAVDEFGTVVIRDGNIRILY